MASEDGVWRTISGRRVFIKKGQSLTDAMKEIGHMILELDGEPCMPILQKQQLD